MKIYVTHSTSYNFQEDLYRPLLDNFAHKHELFLPHQQSNAGVHSKDIIETSDIVLAEVSLPSTGQGIELGWANDMSIPILCLHRKGTSPSGALRFISQSISEYADHDDMIRQLGELLS